MERRSYQVGNLEQVWIRGFAHSLRPPRLCGWLASGLMEFFKSLAFLTGNAELAEGGCSLESSSIAEAQRVSCNSLCAFSAVGWLQVFWS